MIFCFCYFAVAQEHNYSWDFSECELKDILYAMSLDSGISIVADDTVNGKGDLKFAGRNFEDAFEAFLSGNRLFVEKGDIWTVSRFSLQIKDNLFYLDAFDMQPNQILEKLSCGIDAVLMFDSLPAQKISVHFNGVNEAVLMEGLAKRFGNYDVNITESGYQFIKRIEVRRTDAVEGLLRIEKNGKGYSVDIRECKFSDIVEKLFAAGSTDEERHSYCMLSGTDSKIQRSVFNGLDFNDTLSKLCSQAGFAYVFDGELIYIFPEGNVKNELISGLRTWKKFHLKYTTAQNFSSYLSRRLDKPEIIILPDNNSFLCNVSEKEKSVIEELIAEVDVEQEIYLVRLKYIKPADFMAHISPDIDKNALFLADENENLYFKGTKFAYENLVKQLAICDVPVKRISYDLLILQCDENVQKSWGANISAGTFSAGDRNSLSAMLGSVMDFNLNVVTAFGLEFALNLQNSIAENKTKVFADTTLHGISGKQINFQNTNTYRYRDNNVNPETGKPIYSGVTREIISGIKLDVVGWVSGDNMITSTVTASISRQGIDTSASTGNPPPTSEKIITTEVCGKNGEPVILSGLIQTADSNQIKRTPFLSKIPFLGNLFKSKNNTHENSQMVIYLVPHIEGERFEKPEQHFDEKWAENRINDFNRKIKGHNKEVEISV